MTQTQMIMKHPPTRRRIMNKRKKTNTPILPATTPTPIPTATTTTATTTTLPCLPNDIIFFHILPKLPVRCLLRFNSVSKLWYNTIHHPNFHASYLTHAKSNSSLVAMLRTKSCFLRFLHLDDHHHPNPNPNPNPNDNTIATLELQSVAYNIVGTCNGLTCGIHSSAVEIFNPSTRELLELSYPKANWEMQRNAMTRNGFGFDPWMNEYKVIHLWLIDLTKDYECWIYTLGTNKWRNITATCNYQPHCYPFQVNSVCIGGNLFWRTNWNTKILSFDLHHEKFHLLTGPQYPQGSIIHDLFEWEGCPCLVYRRNDNLKDEVQLTLFTLKNYLLLHTEQQQQQQQQPPSSSSSSGARWIKLRHMCLSLNPAIASIRFVEFDKHIYVQWSTMDDHFVLWDLNRKRLIHNKLYPLDASSWVILVDHVESLVSLKTFVPSSSVSACDVEVKYYSSRKARHESPPDHQEQGETKRKKRRKPICNSNGYLIAPCWFSTIM